ncbi:MAG: LysE family transporter, partial [Saprospiraceae bacterium]|nr:LysE family transporter [Saprospiraceae bacterium]
MNLLHLFLFGVVFSALGAIPPGLINLAVAERTLTRGYRAGIMVSLGAGVTQLLYTFIAVYFIDIIIRNAIITQTINWIAGIIFLILGLFYIVKKVKKIQSVKRASDSKYFGYGMAIAAMNFLIIPTWIFVAIWLKGNGYDFTHLREIIFVALGSAAGAIFIFIGYVRMSRYVIRRMSNIIRYTNRFLG